MGRRSVRTLGLLSLGGAVALLGLVVTLRPERATLLSPSVFLPRSVFAEEPGLPVRLAIPAIGVSAAIEHVGTNAAGDMDVPTEYENVAWYSPGTRPGANGNAVIAGHLDSKTGPAIFWDLEKLGPGDIIIVTDDKQHEHHFTVVSIEHFTKENAPRREIFGESDAARLNLITCGGTWDTRLQRYDERIVVFAKEHSDS